VALGILPLFFFAALPLRLILGVPLASGEAPMLLFLMFAVLLFLLVLLGGVALKPGVAWHCSFRSYFLPCCRCSFCDWAWPWCSARTARQTALGIMTTHGNYNT
jgi:hypothetical protein